MFAVTENIMKRPVLNENILQEQPIKKPTDV
jgi:hypothetical protein